MPDQFTPEQIAQILEEFFKVVGTRQYIGARYVPLFGRKDEESIEWDNTAPYEPLTIVLYQGNSYTSRQFVPIGVEITNQEFWAITGNYNAQVELYRRETAAAREVADNALAAANDAQDDIDMLLPKADFSAENTVKKYVDDSVAEVQEDIDTLLPKADFSAENTVKNYVDAQVESLANRAAVTNGFTITEIGSYGYNVQTGSYYVITNTRNTQKAQHEIGENLYAEIIDGDYLISGEVRTQPAAASQFSKLSSYALSYINNSDRFVYGSEHAAFRPDVTQVGGKWQINCSTFAMLLAFGIDYEHSAYALGSGNNKPANGFWGAQSILNWFASPNDGQSGDYRWKYTYDLATYLYERGFCFYPNSDLSNVQSGDMLFMKNQTGSEGNSTFKDIDHSCIFGYWNTDNLYTVFEVGTLPAAAQYYKQNLVDNLVMCARLPMSIPADDFMPMSYQQDVVTSNTNVLSAVRCKPFKQGSYYTLVAEIEYDGEVRDVYPTIYQSTDRLAGYNDAITKPANNRFYIPFVPSQLNQNIVVQMSRRNTSIEQPSATIRNPIVYKGLISSDAPSVIPQRTCVATAENGFTIASRSISETTALIAITGTINTGTNVLAALDGLHRFMDLIPCGAITYPSTGVVSDVEFYIDWRSTSAKLTARNNTGAAVNGTFYVSVPLQKVVL